jgi:hypothetical protein
MKIRPVGAELFQADERTDTQHEEILRLRLETIF